MKHSICPYCDNPLRSLRSGYLLCDVCRSLFGIDEQKDVLLSADCRICPTCGTPEPLGSDIKNCSKCGNLLAAFCNNCNKSHSYGIFFADRQTGFPLPGLLLNSIRDLRQTECRIHEELKNRLSVETDIENQYRQMFGSISTETESWREAIEVFEFVLHHGKEKNTLERLENNLRTNREIIKKLRINLDQTARSVKAMAYNNRILVRVFEVIEREESDILQNLLDD